LTAQGRDDAAAAGRWLATHDCVPDLAVVSPAARAVQTWECAARHLPGVPEVSFDDGVYDNVVERLLAVVRDVPGRVRTLLLVGHNPSTQALAAQLAGGDERARRELEGGFPTSTLAVFDLHGDWSDVAEPGARLVAVSTCRAGAADAR
jgi:phosphohistidine phosphatase